jgi:hypothetical protein
MFGSQIDVDQAVELFKTAWDYGCNFIGRSLQCMCIIKTCVEKLKPIADRLGGSHIGTTRIGMDFEKQKCFYVHHRSKSNKILQV